MVGRRGGGLYGTCKLEEKEVKWRRRYLGFQVFGI